MITVLHVTCWKNDVTPPKESIVINIVDQMKRQRNEEKGEVVLICCRYDMLYK